MEQMEQVRERQNVVLNSFLATKEKIIEQTGKITQSVAEGYLKEQIAGVLPGEKNPKQLPANHDEKFLLADKN